MDTLKVKRGHQNLKVDARYPVVVLTADGQMRGETKHISTQQAFVRCKDPLRLYDVASMSIRFSEEEALLAEGEVIWSNRYGPDDEITPRGMVVRFTRLSPSVYTTPLSNSIKRKMGTSGSRGSDLKRIS